MIYIWRHCFYNQQLQLLNSGDVNSSQQLWISLSLLSVPATAIQEFRFDTGPSATGLLHAAFALPALFVVVSGRVRIQLALFTAQKQT